MPDDVLFPLFAGVGEGAQEASTTVPHMAIGKCIFWDLVIPCRTDLAYGGSTLRDGGLPGFVTNDGGERIEIDLAERAMPRVIQTMLGFVCRRIFWP